jgi:Ribbon-helix-helix protein, copG family
VNLTDATDDALRLLAAGGHVGAQKEIRRRAPDPAPTITRGRGRPSTGTRIEVRLPDDLIAAVDAAAAVEDATRAEMIRIMLRFALNDDGPWRQFDPVRSAPKGPQ